jgi:hypothetical protein
MGGGIVSHYGLSFFGGLVAFIGIIGWSNEPVVAPGAHHAEAGAEH